MRVPVMGDSKQYVLGYKSQRGCWGCRCVVEMVNGVEICPKCLSGGKLLEGGKPCLKCNMGRVIVDEGMVVCF